jgi:hypothetical protein
MALVVVAETPAKLADKLNGLPDRVAHFLPVGIVGTPEQVIRFYESMMTQGVDLLHSTDLDNDTETLDLSAQRVQPALESQSHTPK